MRRWSRSGEVIPFANSHAAALSILFLGIAALCGCPPKQPPSTQPPQPVSPPPAPTTSIRTSQSSAWTLTSSAFTDGETIPAKYTADGEDISPPLQWSQPPEGTTELALTCDDPDAPGGTFNHWVAYGISSQTRGLPEGVPKTSQVDKPALKQGTNSFGKPGYGGPAPPPGKPHRYIFTLYALKAHLTLKPGASRSELLGAMEGKLLAKTTLTGTYGR